MNQSRGAPARRAKLPGAGDAARRLLAVLVRLRLGLVHLFLGQERPPESRLEDVFAIAQRVAGEREAVAVLLDGREDDLLVVLQFGRRDVQRMAILLHRGEDDAPI